MAIASDADRAMALRVHADLELLKYPETHRVTRELYEAVERVLLDWVEMMDRDYPLEKHHLWSGPNGGLMFKNVELLCA